MTREQRRARDAFNAVNARLESCNNEDYGRQCLHLPALIHQCGLCQAVAFFESKGASRSFFIAALDDLSMVMGVGNRVELRNRALNCSMQEYQRWTREALKSAQWLKRYAEALLNVEPGNDD